MYFSLVTLASVTSAVFLVLANNSEVAAVAASVTEVTVKAPAHTVPKKKDPWTTGREAASLWTGDIDGKEREKDFIFIVKVFGF